MKKIFANIVLLFIVAGSSVYAGTDQCFTCHSALGDKFSALYKSDIHFQKGISCAGCHGGDATAEEMEQAMDAKKGFIGIPKGDTISKQCGTCHSSDTKMKSYNSSLPHNQLQSLQNSVHGKLATNGKEHIVQCITCHGVHGIVKVSNQKSPVYPLNIVATCTKCHNDAAYMRSYNPSLSVDQLEKYRTSVHGMKNEKGDAKVAECASCHGSHDIQPSTDIRSRVYAANIPATCGKCHSNADYMKEYHIPTDQQEKFNRSVHGFALLQKKDLSAPACNDCHGNHGATPPGISSISKVCGTCHALNADLFSQSPHKKAYDEKNLPECETCHSNHEIVHATDKLLGVGKDAVCSKCHSETQNPRGYAVAKTMRALVDSLVQESKLDSQLVEDAEQKGMEISESKFKLRDAHQARLESRTMIHSFNEEKFRDVVNKGFSVTAFVKAEASEILDEYYFRRWGLGVSTLIITIVAVSLYLFIRRIERNQQTKSTS